MEKEAINRLHAESFLVCDGTFIDSDAPFFKWLRSERFTLGWHKGNYGACDWAYINITSKQFAYGMPGVSITTPTGNHAITLDEFMTIYNIYRKYDGKELFSCRGTSRGNSFDE